jgi:sulfonate transport system substrate-binding protein
MSPHGETTRREGREEAFMTTRFKHLRLALALGLVLIIGVAWAGEGPSVIRVANPGVGIGNRPVVGGSAWSLLHLQGGLESEFSKDGTKVTWNFLRGAGPAVNELYANGLADIGLLGDLPSIVGHAGGLKTRILASAGRFNLYIAVPSDSAIQSVKDLRGKKLAVFKGTCLQLSANRILEANGLAEGDVRSLNMDASTGRAALVTKDVDALVGGADLFSLRDQGVAKIIYSTKNEPRFACNTTVVASEEFVTKYPAQVKRIVRSYVLASKWLVDHQEDPAEAYRLWSKSGTPFSSFKEDFSGQAFRAQLSPLIDDYLIARYKISVGDAKKYGLIRKTFEVESWVDATFLEQVLKEEKLESFWPRQKLDP